MNDRFRETFDHIHAEAELKAQTKAFIAYQTNHYTSIPHRRVMPKYMAPAAACLLALCVAGSGYFAYFTRTSIISIDINPSIELDINRFDRVIAVNSYNDDGLALAASANVRFMDYQNAIHQIVYAEYLSEYLNRNEMLSISVAGQNEQKAQEMLANIETCVPHQQNVDCYMSNYEEVHEAHSAGLSVGKYRAFLELQEQNPDVTLHDIQGLTMRQIMALIDGQSGENDVPPGSQGTGYSPNNGEHGGHHSGH